MALSNGATCMVSSTTCTVVSSGTSGIAKEDLWLLLQIREACSRIFCYKRFSLVKEPEALPNQFSLLSYFGR
jgi:hypothetical protein